MRYWPTVIVGVVLGVLLLPASRWSLDTVVAMYDQSYPVLRGSIDVLNSDEAGVNVHLYGEKLRPCQFVRLVAYTVDTQQEREDARIWRIDRPETGTTRDLGKMDFGVWRIEPRSDGVLVGVNALHLCGDRLVTSRLPTVPLDKGVAPRSK